MTWIPFKSGIIADIDKVLGKICDPYLDLFKKIIPPIGGMLDISPILAIIVLQLIMRVLYILI
jgi:YggT family protein